MSRGPLGTSMHAPGRLWSGAARLLVAAAVPALVALAMHAALPTVLVPLRVAAVVASLVLALASANVRLQSAGWALEERAITAVYLALASFVALLAFLGCDAAWDSFRLLIRVLVAVGLVGAVLVLLPQGLRRGLILLLVLVHFGGILTCVFSVPPPNSDGCWVTNSLWAAFYRPYLQFAYMNNAYHFYSPDPGPPTLLWFRIEYSDGQYEWVKIPNREDFPTRLQYQRRLSMTESTNQPARVSAAEMQEKLQARRWKASQIPFGPAVADVLQYREPTTYSKLMIAVYARHVALEAREKHPDRSVKGVKVYRVIHEILMPQDMAEGASPTDETTYRPFYMGEFHWVEKKDPQTGKPDINPQTGEPELAWELKAPNDPLLYWWIPIVREPDVSKIGAFRLPGKEDLVLRDYLAVHSGDRANPELPRP